nr:MAG TPA: hypothetical protein [Caudoviricetes sp.]
MADIESPILNPDAPNTRNVYTKHFAYLGPMRPSHPDSLYVYTCACGRGAVSATGKYGAAVSTIHWGAADADGDQGVAAATDDHGTAGSTGWRGVAVSTGAQAAASSRGERGAAVSTGSESDAFACGNHSVAAVTGHRGSASAMGEQAVAVATGSYGSADATSGHGVALATGWGGMVMGMLGCALFAVERIDGNIVSVAAGIVDGVTIMPNTWYECHRGKLYKVIGGPNDQ